MKNTYSIDPVHSSVQFRIRHLMIANVRGAFRILNGTVIFDRDDLAGSSVTADIDATSVSTLDNKHLKSKEFFNVDEFPTFHFASTRIDWGGNGGLDVRGNITVRGITKPIGLRVEGPTGESKDPWGKIRVGAAGSATLKRSDFGLAWNAALETGGVVLGDDIHVELEIQLVKA